MAQRTYNKDFCSVMIYVSFFFRLFVYCCNGNLSSVVLFSFDNFTELCISYEIIFLMVGS